ncbi:MAG: hypothetical protein E6040_08055 [Lachnospiraceae bacterium]|nr:hypothetical protein [Lachnospiraceae bacterium]
MLKNHNEQEELLAHQFIKRDGFEKTAVFMMNLFGLIVDTMRKKERFNIVIQYDTEAINVNIDYLDKTTNVSTGIPLES